MRRAALISLSFALLCSIAAAQHGAQRKSFFFKDEVEIETSYDKFDDKTTVLLSPMTIKSGLLDELGIYAGYAYSGQHRTAPKTFTLGFSYLALADIPNPQFRERRDLILLIDGERVPLGAMIYDSDSKSTLLGTVQMETMKLHLSPQIFVRIATAKSVEARLGTVEFTLTGHHQTGLSKLIATSW